MIRKEEKGKNKLRIDNQESNPFTALNVNVSTNYLDCFQKNTRPLKLQVHGIFLFYLADYKKQVLDTIVVPHTFEKTAKNCSVFLISSLGLSKWAIASLGKHLPPCYITHPFLPIDSDYISKQIKNKKITQIVTKRSH